MENDLVPSLWVLPQFAEVFTNNESEIISITCNSLGADQHLISDAEKTPQSVQQIEVLDSSNSNAGTTFNLNSKCLIDHFYLKKIWKANRLRSDD